MEALTGPQDSVEDNRVIYLRRRDRVVKAVRSMGLKVAVPEASHVEAATAADVVQLALHLLDSLANQPAVRLQLGLSGSPGADTAAKALQVRPLPHQARQQVLVLSQLHL